MKERGLKKRLLSLLLVMAMAFSMVSLPVGAAETDSGVEETSSLDYRIVHLDCGRKYFGVDNIKSIIDTASAAGFNYIELAVGNDGLRFLLDDMSVSWETSTSSVTGSGNVVLLSSSRDYSSDAVKTAIQDANKAYYDAGEANELTQSEMDEIIDYANEKGMGVIPLLNTPGHMNAIVSAMAALGIDGDYNGSANTIDVTNDSAVAFTKALIQKYVDYFAEKGCKVFNFGADEYANDIYSTGGMGFAQLVNAKQYGEFVNYVNDLIAIIKEAGMTPMAFNDGIYYNRDTSTKIDSSLMIAYWSSGWSGYNVASASFLADQGFKMINTHGDYYWVLGKEDAQCTPEKASGFDVTAFMGNSTISDPAGAMFCIWCDVPKADTADNVVANTAATITAFGGALSETTDGGDDGDTATEKTVTDGSTGVSVTAPGLTGLTVSASDVSIAGTDAVLAYDIAPSTDNGAYTGSATVSIPIPADWNTTDKAVKGFVVNDDNSVTMIDGSMANGVFTYTCPHFSDTGIALMSDTVINVVAGGTATATINGVNLNDITPVIGNRDIVTNVTVTGTDGQESTVEYTLVEEVTCNDLISTNTNNSWRETGYYCQVDGNYYSLYAQRSSERNWPFGPTEYTYKWGYSANNSSNNVTKIGSDQTVRNTSATPDVSVYSQFTTEAVPASTTVTFTAAANAAGQSTTVSIGTVTYTVNVIAEDLSSAEELTIEYWITNAHVNDADGNRSIDITAAQAYGENGVAISDLVPQQAVKAGDGYATVYWKARRLPYGYWQMTAGEDGDDRCTDENGTDITYIRYWEGKWSYSSDGNIWREVLPDDQIVAYYMQVSTVTDEVTTVFVDYGVERDGWSGASWLNGKYVRLDFAVRYPSGERVPDSFSTDKTLLYHCDGVGPYRTLKPILGLETAEYEIYLITLTPTSDDLRADFGNATTSTQNYSYDGTEKVAWAATQEDLDNSGMEEWTSISENYSCVIGGSPELQAIEIYNLQGMRVTYYLRAKVTEDSLAVHYIDRTENYEFYNYNIAVNRGTVFDQDIKLNDTWKGDLDNGTVTNSNGRTQTVSSDLATLTELSKAYSDREYICVEVTRSGDGKDVYLYYEFNDTHNVVYDYGIGITVPASELGLTNADAVVAGTARYGTVTVNADNSVTYQPTSMSPRIEDVTLTATFNDTGTEQTITTVLRAIPATSVYYEDDCGMITYSDGWDPTGTSDNSTQAYNTTPYGHDAAYENSGTYSNGSAHTTTIQQGVQTAVFTFTGTGFDIYSQTGEKNGLMSIKVVNDADETVKHVSVQNTGKVTLYQIPVYTIKDLEYDTYTVTITAFAAYENTNYPSLDRGGYHIIDAVQIYNPIGSSGTQYETDQEANAVRLNIRDAIVSAQEYDVTKEGDGILYMNANVTDGGVVDYTLVGPNNEAYFQSTSSMIGFILETSAPVETLQIGAKSADGQAVTLKAMVNGKETSESISTSTAMNYALNLETPTSSDGKYQYTVYISKSAGDGILSITDVKATFETSATAVFKYNEALAANVSLVDPDANDAQIVENSVIITTSRVRYGKDMKIEVTTNQEVTDGQSFTVTAGSRTYAVGGAGKTAMSVSAPVDNGNGTYTYTLTLKPYIFRLFGETEFIVSLANASGEGTREAVSAYVHLF